MCTGPIQCCTLLISSVTLTHIIVSLTREEINFLLMCCDCNHDGKIDYLEFTERFHNPAKEIGFNLAVLLTNLSEHMPNDPRLARFLEVCIMCRFA